MNIDSWPTKDRTKYIEAIKKFTLERIKKMSVYFAVDIMKELLRRNILKITFFKIDGSEREMVCTLQSEYLPEIDACTTSDKPNKITPENIIVVYELNVGWRSFDINRVTSVKVKDFETGNFYVLNISRPTY